MNKEFNDNNYQTSGHHEGQQNNISQQREDGINNPPEVERTAGAGDSQQQGGTYRQEGEEGRSEQVGNTGNETESDRANRNEDEGTRGGNSSI